MALAGLVADYSDSSNDEEDDTPAVVVKEKLSTDYFAASQSDGDDSDGETATVGDTSTLPTPQFASALPNPLAAGQSNTEQSKGTVFGNRFADQEKAELAIYEKHVKMTEDHTSSRLPCFKFKRGACLKGKACRFSHELGFQAPSKAAEQPEEQSGFVSSTHEPAHVNSSKKRVGVTNTMLPAKKAKQSLNAQRAKERPWTVKS